MEDDLKNLIISTLSIDCDSVFDDLSIPCATYDFYSTNPGIFGNGNSTEEFENVQIDLWYKAKIPMQQAADALRKVLNQQSKYTYPYLEKYYDEIAELYRATFKFSILKESEG